MTARSGKHRHNQRRRIFKAAKWTCQCCGWQAPRAERRIPLPPEQRPARFLTLDHIRPRAQGGPNSASNYQALCNLCNEAKGARTQRFARSAA